MLGGHIFSFVSWTDYLQTTPNGFTAPPLSLFAPHFSHPSDLFYFKTDESSLCTFPLLSQDTCCLIRTFLLPWITDLSKSLHTPCTTDCSTRKEVLVSIGDIYCTPTHKDRESGALSYVWKQSHMHQNSLGCLTDSKGLYGQVSCPALHSCPFWISWDFFLMVL